MLYACDQLLYIPDDHPFSAVVRCEDSMQLVCIQVHCETWSICVCYSSMHARDAMMTLHASISTQV